MIQKLIIGNFNKHPKGLIFLFFAELWERFSYYGMRSILVLYLISDSDSPIPGMGWTKVEAISLYGWYTALVYFACIPGGIIADKMLGSKKCVIIGGGLLCIGHLLLSISNNFFFFTGLGFIIIGVGLLKPNISALVGALYKKESNIREQGFTIFYVGINIGAFLASIMVGLVGEIYGWHYGFSLAGIGMIIGQIVFVSGRNYLPETKIKRKLITPKKKLSSIEIDRIKVLLISFLIILFFWASFEQAGGLMNIYIFEKTNRTISWLGSWQIPAGWFQSINPLLIIILGIPISTIWLKLNQKRKRFSSLFKMTTGIMIMGLGFIFMFFASLEFEKGGSSAMYWIFLAFLFHTVGELCASPVVLSFITKLSPVKYISSIMGIYFATMGLGNKLAGTIGQFSQSFGESKTFLGITIFCLTFGMIVMLFLKRLEKLSHNAD